MFGAALLKRNFFKYVFDKTFHYTEEGWDQFTWSFAWFFVITAVANELVRWAFPPPPTEAAIACTKQALEAVNQCVQQAGDAAKAAVAACKNQLGVKRAQCLEPYAYDLFGYKMDGVNIWILFKIALIMPLSGLYAWVLTRLMHKHRLPEPHDQHAPARTDARPGAEFAAAPADMSAKPRPVPAGSRGPGRH